MPWRCQGSPVCDHGGRPDRRKTMKLGMVITRTGPETVFNVLRLALYSVEQGDEVRIS